VIAPVAIDHNNTMDVIRHYNEPIKDRVGKPVGHFQPRCLNHLARCIQTHLFHNHVAAEAQPILRHHRHKVRAWLRIVIAREALRPTVMAVIGWHWLNAP